MRSKQAYFLAGLAVCLLIVLLKIQPDWLSDWQVKGSQTTVNSPYTDPSQLTELPFGYQSHWLQPWRAYLETMPAATFLQGTGINFNVPESVNPDLVAQMLAQHGIHRARVEIGWGNFQFEDESKLNRENEWRAILLALKKFGIRPLILLNAHHGVPCPTQFVERTVTLDAVKGETQLELDDVSGLQVGYSGLSNLTEYWAAEALIADISGQMVTLSKPLPKDMPAGTTVLIATLRYRPFSPPGSADYQETLSGWLRYLDSAVQLATEVLGTSQSADKGFDLEIWNELTFGSNFLDINQYYAHKLYRNDPGDPTWKHILAETAAHAAAQPQLFAGIELSNGFANTIPWPAASEQPLGIHALSKHPYRDRYHFPQDELQGKDEFKNQPVNALLQAEDKSTFVPPTYSTFFPEFFATALQTETIVRDLAPITSDIYGSQHGRYARIVEGKMIPTPVWITEVNLDLKQDNPDISPERALALKAKASARYFGFYLNKGATQVHLYAAAGGDTGLGIVQDNFWDYAKQPQVTYPTSDRAYTSPALLWLSRIVAQMSQHLDPDWKKTRLLQVVSISDSHDRYQFQGDGTAAHPPLYDRDVLPLLPFQVNSHRFVIPYYVMTRDITQDLAPEAFTVQLKGLKAQGASFTAYDPAGDRSVPVTINHLTADSASIDLLATDYPYLLIVEESDS
jgi:hypothetical protein